MKFKIRTEDISIMVYIHKKDGRKKLSSQSIDCQKKEAWISQKIKGFMSGLLGLGRG